MKYVSAFLKGMAYVVALYFCAVVIVNAFVR